MLGFQVPGLLCCILMVARYQLPSSAGLGIIMKIFDTSFDNTLDLSFYRI